MTFLWVQRNGPNAAAQVRFVRALVHERWRHWSLCAATPPSSPFGATLSQREEDAMILVVLDPRTGERFVIEIADTAQGKKVVRTTRRSH